eukprot:COSAG04_NODE_338_length_16370_cov_18.584230_2_plen_311_part_00
MSGDVSMDWHNRDGRNALERIATAPEAAAVVELAVDVCEDVSRVVHVGNAMPSAIPKVGGAARSRLAVLSRLGATGARDVRHGSVRCASANCEVNEERKLPPGVGLVPDPADEPSALLCPQLDPRRQCSGGVRATDVRDAGHRRPGSNQVVGVERHGVPREEPRDAGGTARRRGCVVVQRVSANTAGQCGSERSQSAMAAKATAGRVAHPWSASIFGSPAASPNDQNARSPRVIAGSPPAAAASTGATGAAAACAAAARRAAPRAIIMRGGAARREGCGQTPGRREGLVDQGGAAWRSAQCGGWEMILPR